MATFDPFSKPGHLIRRLQQRAVFLFEQEMAESRLTPTQYVALQVLETRPGIDQVTLSRLTSVDRSMTARNVEILAGRGLIDKRPAEQDRRANSLFIRPTAVWLLRRCEPKADRSQDRILKALEPAERTEFMRLVRKIIAVGRDAATAAGEDGQPTRKVKPRGRGSPAEGAQVRSEPGSRGD